MSLDLQKLRANDWVLENPITPDDLEAALRGLLNERYHNQHPFHAAMRDGKLSKGALQAWALNRYLYQSRVPLKDAALMARLHDVELRREWRRRIEDHDGREGDEGGVERWIKLCEGLGLDRAYVLAERGALPATHFAVNAYVRFVAERSLLEAIASSLTELFAPTIIADRVAGMLANYDYVDETTLSYFNNRLTQAPMDSTFALNYCKAHAKTQEQQQSVIEALRFKTGLLWAMLDALDYAYGAGPHVIPPGAFVSKAV